MAESLAEPNSPHQCTDLCGPWLSFLHIYRILQNLATSAGKWLPDAAQHV